MSSLESVDCIFQFFGEGPQFAVVEEHTCSICIEGSDFDCVADFSVVTNFIQRFVSLFSSTSRYIVGLFHILLS